MMRPSIDLKCRDGAAMMVIPASRPPLTEPDSAMFRAGTGVGTSSMQLRNTDSDRMAELEVFPVASIFSSNFDLDMLVPFIRGRLVSNLWGLPYHISTVSCIRFFPIFLPVSSCPYLTVPMVAYMPEEFHLN